MEIRGSHNDRPFAVGTKDSLGVGSAAIRISAHRHNSIIVLVEERYLIIAGHSLSRLDIFDFVDDKTITQNENLINASQSLTCLGLCGIGPREMTRQRDITVNGHLKICRSLGHSIVDVVGNKIHDNTLATRILEVLTIDKEVIVVGTAPTKVEVEQTVDIVTVADEGMSAIITMA